MRRILPLLVVGLLVLSGLGAVAGSDSEAEQFFSENITFSQPVISEDGNYLTIGIDESISETMEEDKPMLPVVTKVYTFPFGTKIESVAVDFSEFIDMQVTSLIKPAPETLPVSMGIAHNVKDTESIVSYEGIDVYPQEQYGYRISSGLNGNTRVVYVSVPIIPVKYYPNENKISYTESARVEIVYEEPAEPITFDDEYDYLIIAPAEFESALQRLVDHKNNLNPPIDTVLVTLDEIPSGVGVDEQEDIKYFIKDSIENWGITYVLLVGAGVADQELFPVRYAWISDEIEDNFPSDLYYADIYDGTGGFSDWDEDNDGKYGEYPQDVPSMDIIPDVHLGKMPANNVAEVNTVIDKIIDYKAHNKMTRKILQLGGDTFTGNTQIEGEYANTKVLEVLPGYSTTQLWASTDTITKPNIADGYKNNVDFIDFSGHGAPNCWGTHPEDDEDTWLPYETMISPYPFWIYVDLDLYLVNNNKKLPVVFHNACSNHKYTKSESTIGWYTLSKKKGGGIASFGASGIGYGVPGNEVSRRFGWMEVHCFDELYNTKELGQVWTNCITDYYNTFESNLVNYDYKTMVEFSMFGDPTLVIQDGDDPHSRSTDVPFILERLLENFPRIAELFRQIFTRFA